MNTEQTRVFVITPQGERIDGTIIEPEHDETFTTSRSWGETWPVVTIEWDDGDITGERPGDFRIAR